MFLRVRGDVIEECFFETDSCGSTQVAGSAANLLGLRPVSPGTVINKMGKRKRGGLNLEPGR
ncbi:MAG: hypothetical protein ACUVR0_08480 [Candidatus Aminicenantales bacterium]